MKNKLFYLFAILFSAILFTSCTTARGGYSSGKKGYGCPNSAGIKVESKAKSITA